MSYLVIARKYRPSTFDDLVGQKTIVTTLKNAIKSNRVAHAYLFAGPRGVGKTSMARILSKALNCDKGITESPCNECDICKSISNGNDLDVLEIDGASNRGIDEIRNIRQNVNYAPARARFKIYIIDEVHMLTKEAFNALLKTLEEPPMHVKFIFATTSADKLPETVQSRCQRFDFKNISSEDLENQISLVCEKEKIKAEKDVCKLIAKYARGGLRDALSLLDQLISFSSGRISLNDVHDVLGTIDEEGMFELVNSILNNDLKKAVQNLEAIFDKGNVVSDFVDQIVWYIRDLLIAFVFKDNLKTNENLSESQIKLIIDHKTISIDLLTYIIQVLSNVKNKAKDDRHRRILLETAIIKLATTEDISPINEIIERIEKVEKMILSLSNGSTNALNNFGSIASENNRREVLFDAGIEYSNKENSDTLYNNAKNRIKGYDSELNKDAPPATAKSVPADVEEIDKNERNTELHQGDNNSVWAGILSKAESKRKSLWAVLRECRLISYDNKQIVIEFPENFNFHKVRLEKPDEKKTIEEFAEAVTGEKVSVKFLLSEKPARKREEKKKDEASGDGLSKTESETGAKTSGFNTNQTDNHTSVPDEDIMNNDCVQKAIKIFDGHIVDIRRIEK